MLYTNVQLVLVLHKIAEQFCTNGAAGRALVDRYGG
jgi:hypothetical protein